MSAGRCPQSFYTSWERVPIVLNTKEAAKLLGRTPGYISKLASQGEIPARKLGHDWYISKETLKKRIEGGEKA